MILFIEGLSRSGKTTLIDKYLGKYEGIRFKGAGAVNIGMMQRWQEYNYWMHNIIERLDQVNNYKIPILWDRGITDPAYTEDNFYSSEIIRVAKSHEHKALIFIDLPGNVLKSRITKEGPDASAHHKKYLEIVKSFDTLHIKPNQSNNYYITDDEIEQMHAFVIACYTRNKIQHE